MVIASIRRGDIMKRIYICLLCIVIIISTLVSCVPKKWAENHPSAFPDTIWATADNSVVIEIDTFGGGYKRGYINTGEDILEVFFSIPKRTDVCVKTKEQIETNDGQSLEIWNAQTPEKDKFVVTVTKTTYFNVGDVLTFYNVGENTNNNNHISYDTAKQKAIDALPKKDYEPALWISRKETKNGNVCFVFYAQAMSWIQTNSGDWERVDVITNWVYIDAVTGEVYEVKDTGNTVYATQEEFLASISQS